MYKISDLLLDREILLNQIKKWKWLFFLSCFALIISFTNFKKSGNKDIIAQVDIVGIIDHRPELIEELKNLETSKQVKALVLYIDSPGGTTYASEEIYTSLKNISKKKPVVAVLGTVAASGGYMVAMAADHILARNMTITGSIGVLAENFEITELAQKLGIKLENYKSSPLKASPNPFEKTNEEVKNAEMQVIKDSYDIFVNMLMDSRKLKKDQALKLADGKIYIGKTAKELKLIDNIGNIDDALLWLEKEKKIDGKTPLVNIEWNKPKSFIEDFLQKLNQSKILNSGFNVKAIAK